MGAEKVAQCPKEIAELDFKPGYFWLKILYLSLKADVSKWENLSLKVS